jgi:hypothetical protein
MGAHVALEVHPAVVGHAPDADGSCDVLGAAVRARFVGQGVDADVTALGDISSKLRGR